MAQSKNRKISVNEISITVSTVNNDDYINLTDMVKGFDGGDQLIYNWMRNRNTIEFLGIWEQINNSDFKGIEFETFKSQAGLNSFSLTPKKWIDATNAIGLVSRAGRYNGGTYAHKDIAFEFGSWLSPEFKLYLIKEFQRLKEQEAQQNSIEWQVKRELAKVNYHVHTDAVQMNLLTNVPASQHGFIYASEADLFNVVMFGKTHKEWQQQNPSLKGNQRDHATVLDNAIIANLELQNSLLINQGYPQSERLTMLKELEKTLRESMSKSPAMKRLEQQAESPQIEKKP
ncbi:TPA: KilA-N domain-containing protein [Acinetobacter baumannii]|uniref:KilA-N domain-containing protein n=1 Tax=Acinetobacter TaxID=469 RepID=UPI0002CEC1B1|nr:MULTISPECIES: KilA-N domain-containing protein [Acinetobacter]EHU1404983.1 KilA-N domain-containing protein [Acinetobacter baumannii]EHU2566605.1 KilA-N domain-containing protein [Acinetobacter baumannii]EKU0661541.1 KilA-N domain-containing protein [Acinetobacter baumannii]EKU2444083.1 KilA-N domain-containing protein [Acinetobacter baumannii]EKU2731606.1 KilA-N domain-containing protein [Acinetobacter baumannii]